MKEYRFLKDLPDEIIFKRYMGSEYYVSNTGMVYSSQCGKMLKGYLSNEYLWFDLWVNGEKIRKSKHRLIAECFIPNPENLPIVRHLNDNPFDVRLCNLAWGTKSDNMNDAVKNGRIANRPSPKGEKNRNCKLTEQQIISIRQDINSGVHYTEISTKYGISVAYIYNIKAKRVWKHIA